MLQAFQPNSKPAWIKIANPKNDHCEEKNIWPKFETEKDSLHSIVWICTPSIDKLLVASCVKTCANVQTTKQSCLALRTGITLLNRQVTRLC